MDDSIRKVLEMLSEGKINAEEAERLINALKGPERKDYAKGFTDNISKGVASILESVPNFVEPFVDPINVGTMETIDMENKQGLEVKLIGGSLQFSQSDTGKLDAMSNTGIVRINEEGDLVSIKVVGTSMNLEVPKIKTLQTKIMGGNIEGSCPAEEIELVCKGGDIDLALPFCREIKFNGYGGNLSLRIPQDGDFDIQVKKWMGNFTTDLPLEVLEDTDNYYKAKLNKGGNLIEIECKAGNVFLSGIEPSDGENV
ncbi:hypothetical protein JXI42_13660 [bacterium]|nr:hypothetical protein [bacterium]